LPRLDTVACAALLEALTALSARAAEAILDTAGGGTTRRKADGSPVTQADEAAEAVILDGLCRLAPDVPAISEEHAAHAGLEGAAGSNDSYFLVDPLDGTREFIAGRDEYAINIAIVTGGAPILGIITAPALGVAWRGIVGRGAERISLASGKSSAASAIRTRLCPKCEPVILLSRSHLDARTEAYIEALPQAKRVQLGSAIKFCRIAEGTADIYPRLAPTHDWDTAAGHALVKAAGGRVSAPDGRGLVYGSRELLLPAFIAAGDPAAFV
jgi:3'(2'), 5'-bisphosphate nucleotidase